jgi:hypothetical protein
MSVHWLPTTSVTSIYVQYNIRLGEKSSPMGGIKVGDCRFDCPSWLALLEGTRQGKGK